MQDKETNIEIIYMCDDPKCRTENKNRTVWRLTAQAYKNGVPKFDSCMKCGSPIVTTRRKDENGRIDSI